MNTDIPKLKRVRCIMLEAEAIEQRILWQRERMTRVSPYISDMPRCKELSKGFDDAIARVSELEDSQRTKLAEYAEAVRAAERILLTIVSDEIRVFVRMTYVENLHPMKVRRVMSMSEKRLRGMRKRIESAESMACIQ